MIAARAINAALQRIPPGQASEGEAIAVMFGWIAQLAERQGGAERQQWALAAYELADQLAAPTAQAKGDILP